MPRERGLNRDFCRFFIPNLAHHNNIGVLPHDGTQGTGKIQINLCFDLNLVNTVNLVFYGVFHGDDFIPRMIYPP